MIANRRARQSATAGVADTGASAIYFSADAPVTHVDTTEPVVVVGTSTGQRQQSVATAQHQIPDLPDAFLRTGHVMPGFQQTIIGIGPICDARFTVTFLEDAVVVHDDAKRVILSGCRDPKVPPALWYFNLLPDPDAVPVPTAT